MFWIRHRLQHLEVFSSGSRTIRSIKILKPLYYLYNSLSPQTMSMELEPKFQAPIPPSKTFCLRLQPSKIALVPAPAPQPWLRVNMSTKTAAKGCFWLQIVSQCFSTGGRWPYENFTEKPRTGDFTDLLVEHGE